MPWKWLFFSYLFLGLSDTGEMCCRALFGSYMNHFNTVIMVSGCAGEFLWVALHSNRVASSSSQRTKLVSGASLCPFKQLIKNSGGNFRLFIWLTCQLARHSGSGPWMLLSDGPQVISHHSHMDQFDALYWVFSHRPSLLRLPAMTFCLRVHVYVKE